MSNYKKKSLTIVNNILLISKVSVRLVKFPYFKFENVRVEQPSIVINYVPL